MSLASGALIGHYEIRSHLGTGGMGEVYLARDTQLGRLVALKLLLPELTKSKEHLRRFEQEARATSALNHPNILTIHEIGKAEFVHFIATEFVAGQTLRSIIKSRKAALAETLDIIIQIASGLAAAHAAGIIHRDIKPENVIVRPDGYVKILDFGLAKLSEPLDFHAPALSQEATISNIKTVSGTIVGTISYMSPEQLRGQATDARADLWSLGVVLYEMCAGRTPFEGASPADVTVSILEKEPLPLTKHVPGCPPELERLVLRLLAKKKDERCQTAHELLAQLHQIRGTLSGDTRLGQSLPPAVDDVAAALARSNPQPGNTDQTSAPRATVITNVPGVVSRWPRSRRLKLLPASLLTALALALLVFTGFFLLRQRTGHSQSAVTLPEHAPAMKLTMLIDTGNVTDAAVSPDGKYLIYAVEESGQQSLWVRQVASGSNIQLIPPAAVRYSGVTFTPDGNYVYYLAFEKNYGILYRVPMLGGSPRKILEDVDSPVTFSPDGKQFAFVRGYPGLKETGLFTVGADGSGERRLATRKAPEYFGWKGGPAWSPDGQTIVCATGVYDLKMNVVEVDVADGHERRVFSSGWTWVGRLVWQRDGTGLLMSAKDFDSAPAQVWHISYPGGAARRVTTDLNNYSQRGISITADSRQLVAVQSAYISSVWVAPHGDASRAHQISLGRSDGFNGLAWSPDGRIVYASNASGNQDIWVMNGDGSGARQLTSGGSLNYHPTVTNDGRYIVFVSNRAGSQSIWRMDINGDNLKQLTTQWVANWPHCSPDSQWVFYKSFAAGRRTLWKVHIDGGEPVQVTDAYTAWPAVSPDGKFIACEYWEEGDASSPFSLALLPIEGGAALKTFSPVPGVKYLSRVIRWTADGSSLTYISNPGGVSNIWRQPLAGGAPTRLTSFKSDEIFWFDWSRDGKALACARGVMTSGVVLISDF